MKKNMLFFVKMTNFEIERLSKFLFSLIGLTLLANTIGYIYLPIRFINDVNAYVVNQSSTTAIYLENFGPLRFNRILDSSWLILPIAIGVSGLLFYSLFIWYREWMGKNTFAYRLLMLPIPRMTLYYSKLTALFISIFSLISIQMVSVFIGYQIVSASLPSELFSSIGLMEALNSSLGYNYIFPLDTLYFLGVLGVGFVAMNVLFTLILMERSFKVKGIVYGGVYAFTAFLFMLSPLLIPEITGNYYIIYATEMILLIILLGIVVVTVSLFISSYLINRKITV